MVLAKRRLPVSPLGRQEKRHHPGTRKEPASNNIATSPDAITLPSPTPNGAILAAESADCTSPDGAGERFSASDAIPRDLQVLPLVYLVDERVSLPRPRRIEPVRESPRPVMSGSFAKGTIHLTALAHPAFWLASTVFAGRLPRHTLCRHIHG